MILIRILFSICWVKSCFILRRVILLDLSKCLLLYHLHLWLVQISPLKSTISSALISGTSILFTRMTSDEVFYIRSIDTFNGTWLDLVSTFLVLYFNTSICCSSVGIGVGMLFASLFSDCYFYSFNIHLSLSSLFFNPVLLILSPLVTFLFPIF